MTQRSILIVEDESLIAMMLEDFIDALDHKLAGSVDSTTDAIETIAREPVDLAILDVHLRGGEPCWPVADVLAERGIPFVLATGGHTEPPPARHADAPVLAKPYTLADVERVIDATA